MWLAGHAFQKRGQLRPRRHFTRHNLFAIGRSFSTTYPGEIPGSQS